VIELKLKGSNFGRTCLKPKPSHKFLNVRNQTGGSLQNEEPDHWFLPVLSYYFQFEK
jgi:hypothetical protein